MLLFKKIFFSFFAFLLSCNVYSQNQNKIWYFGDYAGLDFNSGSPVPLLSSALFTNEGCSSIADNSGNLLFYTDGITVWNKVHTVMPNGFGLLGNPSTTQSSMIIPMPGSAAKYYIFAIDDLGGPMTYSIVDMTLAAGLGDVTAVKNVMLHPSVSEKQAAIKRCDGNIWVISHESTTNTFFADLVTPAGISTSMLSSVGTSHIGGSVPFANTVGQLKISQQGDRIGLAIRDAALYEVFDFDINTGAISNPITIGAGLYSVAYGVEFSPDGTKLYGGRITTNIVYQFNLMAGSAAAISASATIVGSTSGFTNSLQLGTDGKIYVAKSISQTVGLGYLDVINNPNVLGGACSYVSAGVTLGGKLSLLGLPGMMVVDTMLLPSVSISGTNSICAGQSTTLTATGGASYVWSGGSSATTASITVSPLVTTDYYATTTLPCGSSTDTITVTVNPIPIATIIGDDSLCSGENIVLTASGSSLYQWSGGSTATTQSISVSPTSTTTYSVVASNGACSSLPVSITVFVNTSPSVSIFGQDSICQGSTTNLLANVSGGSSPYNYLWSNGSTLSNTNISPIVFNTPIGIEVVDQNGCKDSTSINISMFPDPTALVTGELWGCSPMSATFTNLSSNATSYFWNFGDGNTSNLSNPINIYTDSGSYNVTLIATNAAGCSDTITVNSYVNVNDGPTANISVQTSTSVDNQSTTIYNNSQGGDNCVLYFGDGDSLVGCNWLSVIHSYSSEGVYTITQVVTNSSGCSDVYQVIVTVEFESSLFVPNAFTPNASGLNDYFKVYGVGLADFKLMIFDRWGELIFETDDITKGWDGNFKGIPVQQGVYVWKVNYRTKKDGDQFRIGHVSVVR